MTRTIITTVSAAALALAALASAAWAGAAPEEAAALLHERGYTDVEIATNDAPGYMAWGCRHGTHFAIRLDEDSNIVDVDPVGPCGAVAGRGDAPPREGSYAYAPPPPYIDRLHRKGFYDIQVIDIDDDEVEVLACKRGKLYKIEIEHGRIDDIDREGRCGARRHSGVDVDAPFAGVRVDRGEVDVEAPFTGVHVGEDGVRVRAPFVDLHVPK